MNFLSAFCIFLLIAIFIVWLIKTLNEDTAMLHDIDDVTETTTTTTTTTVQHDEAQAAPSVDSLPPLDRQFKANGQPFCIDPADGAEWMLNTTDDIYQDANDKWYRLVTPNTCKA